MELWEKKHLARPHSDQNRQFKTSVITTPWPCFAVYSVMLSLDAIIHANHHVD